MKFVQYYWKQLVAKILLFLLFFVGCTNSPSGAIEYNTTVYYIDGKFHEEIPEEYIFKTWGYRITDALGTEHTYKKKVDIPHQRTETKFCTIHKGWENIKAMWAPNNNGYWYYVSRHKRF